MLFDPANEPVEDVVAPELPIVDPHHHLWDQKGNPRLPQRYLLEDLLRDTNNGHNIVATVYLEAGAMYRKTGPEELRTLGETEFANGIAAMSASGIYGPTQACAGIVSKVNLSLGDPARDVLEAHQRAAGSRLKGIRDSYVWANFVVFGRPVDPARQHMLRNPAFRRGFAQLAPLGLHYEGWGFHYQIPELTEIARAFPDTSIVLNHVGTPLMIGPDARPEGEVFPEWKRAITELATCPNVVVKLGGLGMQFLGPEMFERNPRPTSDELVPRWRPYFETCIEAFGVDRCMCESNFPVDLSTCSYRTLWNAFKKIAAGASESEKTALFSGTAKRIYRLTDV